MIMLICCSGTPSKRLTIRSLKSDETAVTQTDTSSIPCTNSAESLPPTPSALPSLLPSPSSMRPPPAVASPASLGSLALLALLAYMSAAGSQLEDDDDDDDDDDDEAKGSSATATPTHCSTMHDHCSSESGWPIRRRKSAHR